MRVEYANGHYVAVGAVVGDAAIGVLLRDGRRNVMPMPKNWERVLRDNTRAAVWLASLGLGRMDVESFLVAECAGGDVWKTRVTYENRTLTWHS